MLNFAKWLLNEDIRGEYWIDDSGMTHYADGDVGDLNHEGYVVSMLIHQLADHDNWDKYKEELGKEMLDDYINRFPNSKQQLIDSYKNDPDKFFQLGVKRNKIQKEVAVIEGGDARLYAIKNWNWKAVRGHNVETWRITPNDLKIIAKGIGEILDSEGDEESDPELYIYSYATKTGQDYLLSQIETGNTSGTRGIETTWHNDAATQAIKNLEKQNLNPYYKHLGDWYEII